MRSRFSHGIPPPRAAHYTSARLSQLLPPDHSEKEFNRAALPPQRCLKRRTGDRQQSFSPKTGRAGFRPTWRNCRTCCANFDRSAVAERYLVRLATILVSLPATSAVCADCSDATEDTSGGGLDSDQQVLTQPQAGYHTQQVPPQPPQPQPQPPKKKPPHLQRPKPAHLQRPPKP
jgi:hypothetical protein